MIIRNINKIATTFQVKSIKSTYYLHSALGCIFVSIFNVTEGLTKEFSLSKSVALMIGFIPQNLHQFQIIAHRHVEACHICVKVRKNCV